MLRCRGPCPILGVVIRRPLRGAAIGGHDGGGSMSKRNIEVSEERLVEEGEVAGDYLEQLLDILDFDGDIDLDVEGDRAVVSIVGGADLDTLVGSDGSVLDAIQELTRL